MGLVSHAGIVTCATSAPRTGAALTDAPVAPGPRPRVFLSYARKDRPLAEPLIRELEAAGYDVWWAG